MAKPAVCGLPPLGSNDEFAVDNTIVRLAGDPLAPILRMKAVRTSTDRIELMKSPFRSLLAAVVVLPVAFSQAPAKAADNIVDTAVKAGSFTTLVTALKAAGLVETLEGPGPFTVFAPNDAAFAKLPKGTVEDLLKPANKAKLVAILTYHVVPGNIMSGGIAGKKMNVKTVEGGELAVDATNGVKVDNAKVVTADIVASNGVIHVVDTVLIPKS